MRLIEIRILDGPNVYRLEPAAKLEIAIGPRRSWSGQREPARHAVVHLGGRVPRRDWPKAIAAVAGWAARLGRIDVGASPRVAVHRGSDPGHWVITWRWRRSRRAEGVAEAAFELARRGLDPAHGVTASPAAARLVARWRRRITDAGGAEPTWIRDADRRVPVVSISGTNGKSTTTRLVTRILRQAERHVGTTTSDGILLDEVLVEEGDWTGPGGARAVLDRPEVEVAVLETARGGLLLRGVGYESNDASILTNVSSDHMDLQGVHTLPELAEVKATICRITRPGGWVVLNADDRYVAAIARSVRAQVALFTLNGDRSRRVAAHLARGGRAYLVRDGVAGEVEGRAWHPIAPVAEIPITVGGAARHNVANALAAAAGARALGASINEVSLGLRSFDAGAGSSPGRMNVFRRGDRVVIVDFAHNEAGLVAVLDVAEAIARGLGRGRARATVAAVVGTAGDRPDDTLRGMGRIAARRADRLALKETIRYLRGRSRESVIAELREGAADGGWHRPLSVYESEPEALTAELDREVARPEVLVVLCHEDRDGLYDILGVRGFAPVERASELAAIITPGARSNGA
ncbi:MAG TPA: Mur ligase family protein [Candidatus Limnocylindrales bacterium]|nr:Mur ligase family protein [Candidatus Limnocylindrales bacterium]